MPLGGRDRERRCSRRSTATASPPTGGRAPREPQVRAGPALPPRRQLRRAAKIDALLRSEKVRKDTEKLPENDESDPAVAGRGRFPPPRAYRRKRQLGVHLSRESAGTPQINREHIPSPLTSPARRARARRASAPQEARRAWLARARQGRGHDLDARRRGREAHAQRQEGRATPVRSTPSRPGILPIALGEATKTVPFVMDGQKVIRVHRDVGRRDRHR
jgi:hypothetical protein